MHTTRSFAASALLFCVIAVAACSKSEPGAATNATPAAAPAPPPWTLTMTPSTGPAGANSSLPQLSSSDRGVIASWVEQNGKMNTLKFSERTDAGWSTPMTITSGNNWFLSYADPPNVLRRPDGTLVANWLISTNPLLEGSDLNISYSKDDGKTWAKPLLPHHDGTKGQHAFPSIFEMPGNQLGVVWVDARAQAANPEDLEASYAVRYATFDSSWKRVSEGEIDKKTCECCGTSAAMTTDGVIAVFRDRSDKEIRDIGVSRFENGKWTETSIVHDDNFETYSCPVNGPMVAARGNNAVVAWFTVKNDLGQAWAAFSSDGGKTWAAPIRLDDAGSLGRVDVELLEDGSAVASYVEYADKKGQFRVRRIEPSGMKSAAVQVAGVEGSSSSGFPRMARRGNELVFAWTESAIAADGSTPTFSVKTATAPLPK